MVATELLARAGAATAVARRLVARPDGKGREGAGTLQTHLHYARPLREAAEVGEVVFAADPPSPAQTAFEVACSWAKAGRVDHALALARAGRRRRLQGRVPRGRRAGSRHRASRSPLAPRPSPPDLMTKPFLLGVAGGSGSGKTTVAERLAGLIGGTDARAAAPRRLLPRPQPPARSRSGRRINYDHPDAFDWPLLLDHVRALQEGIEVQVPVYDFATYQRLPDRLTVAPARIVVVEGILVLYEPELRERFDLRVFVDTDADVRFIRRLERDVAERERSPRERHRAVPRPRCGRATSSSSSRPSATPM